MLLDLPTLDTTIADTPRVCLAAAGTGPGWRRAAIDVSFDNGASWQSAGRSAAPAVIGRIGGAMTAAAAALFGRSTSIDVVLLNEGMALSGAGEAELVDGANLALIGDELIQFGTARQIGPTRWRIGDLLRGRRGTEWAIAGHAPGERFVLLDPATLLPLDVPLSQIGAMLLASGQGPGDAGTPANDAIAVTGQALRPPCPVGLRASRRGDGAIEIGWTRRSRGGWAWLDGVDAPLGEDRELYALRLQGAGGAERRIEVGAPNYVYSAADQAADRWGGMGLLTASIAQIGTHAASLPAAQAAWHI